MPLSESWLVRGLILLIFSSGLSGQSHPVRIPKILYSCDTAGVLGCFPLIRNGDKSYTLGNASKASLSGEEAAIAVEQFDGIEIVISYKDLDKSAIFSGRVTGNRIQGAVVSSTSAGGKIVKLDGKWTALLVSEPADFSQMAARVPAVMNVCQSNDDNRDLPKEDCFAWSWDTKSPVFAGNLMTIERFDNGGVTITGMSQHGTGGLVAYSGKISGNSIQGAVDYFSGDGHHWVGKWTASFTPSTHK